MLRAHCPFKHNTLNHSKSQFSNLKSLLKKRALGITPPPPPHPASMQRVQYGCMLPIQQNNKLTHLQANQTERKKNHQTIQIHSIWLLNPTTRCAPPPPLLPTAPLQRLVTSQTAGINPASRIAAQLCGAHTHAHALLLLLLLLPLLSLCSLSLSLSHTRSPQKWPVLSLAHGTS